MRKPEKKEVSKWRDIGHWENIGYNQACNDWEKWLPNEEEIIEIGEQIAPELIEMSFPKGKCKERGKVLVLNAEIVLAYSKAISKRIRGEE